MNKIASLILFFVVMFHNGLTQKMSEKALYPEIKNKYESPQLYPHPATEFLTIKLPNPNAKRVKLIIRSLIGNWIDVEKTYLNNYEIRLKVQDLPLGYYFLSIQHEDTGKHSIHRFLKR